MSKRLVSIMMVSLMSMISQSAFAETVPQYLQNIPGPSLASQNANKLSTFVSRYEEAVRHPWQRIPENIVLKPGMHGHYIVLLRERLAATEDLPGFEPQSSDTYDVALKMAVENYQQRMGLNPDGVVGHDTLVELNVPPDVRLKQILINEKRWAELMPKLPSRFIIVNIPDFRLYAYENGQTLFNIKTIVGRPTRQTPEISSEITRLVFNPYWNVPNLIAQKDIVPKVLDDPGYLTDMHIRILNRQEDDATEIPESAIDWEQVADNGFPYHFRQDPGIDNALGLVKFEFANSNNIYLHDTPAKTLFAVNKRLFSSGCIRLENPFALVAWLMEPDPKWNEDKMQKLIDAGKTVYVKAAKPTPIFIMYLTAWVDDRGALNFRDDVYGQDQPSDTLSQSDATEDST
ncbi:MAG: L,D-transpeptidase family protein [Gammaproteobacteria bacterium]|nr:L,D-transpeptidase family protein [Gammaproteobacteria bacterium]